MRHLCLPLLLAAACAEPVDLDSHAAQATVHFTCEASAPASCGLELAAVIEGASLGDTVYIADDAVIDLTGAGTILVPGGVTVASGRGPSSEGALLYTGLDRGGSRIVFEIAGDGVRITGLRLRGPSGGTSPDLEPITGIRARGRLDVRIDHNELFHFTGAAVEVGWRSTTTPAAAPGDDPVPHDSAPRGQEHRVLVEHNFIHHNLRRGLGYGVVVSQGGKALIRRNVFNYNRHAVTSDGRYGSGYIVAHNFALSGAVTYDGAYTPHIDVHGDGEIRDHADYNSDASGEWYSDYKGGTAGEYFEVTGNTVRGDQSYGSKTRSALILRGEPTEQLVFRDNVVEHGSASKAFDNNQDAPNVDVAGNQYGVDTRAELAAGDFDGDGLADVFQATGTDWYYSSAGVSEWRHLNQSDRRLADLILADFDGDGITDVFTKLGSRWYISWSGTEPWDATVSSGVAFESLRVGQFDSIPGADIFYSNGSRWYYSSGASSSWKSLVSSGVSLDSLRFGDFDGNGLTDVVRHSGSDWLVSWDARSSWTRLGPARHALASCVLADFDGDGRTDLARQRFRSTGVSWERIWEHSPGGSAAWVELATLTVATRDALDRQVLADLDGDGDADALHPYGERFYGWTGGATFTVRSRHAMQ